MVIDLNNTKVGEIVAANPGTATVFRKLNIDYCCGGKISLAAACHGAGADPEEVLEELLEVNDGSHLKFGRFEPDFLIDYIVNVHHQYLYDNLPEIEFFVNKVYTKHGDKYAYLAELAALFVKLDAELTDHMPKEEEILFPYAKELLNARRAGIQPQSAPFGTVANPIRMMLHEHDEAGAVLMRIREITHDYTPPADACNSHLVMLHKLKELDADLIQHIHLENNILFPKIEALEAGTV
mgnify:CR=1 FL=1